MGFVKIEQWSQKGLQECNMLEVQDEFWLWCKEKNKKKQKMIYYHMNWQKY